MMVVAPKCHTNVVAEAKDTDSQEEGSDSRIHLRPPPNLPLESEDEEEDRKIHNYYFDASACDSGGSSSTRGIREGVMDLHDDTPWQEQQQEKGLTMVVSDGCNTIDGDRRLLL